MATVLTLSGLTFVIKVVITFNLIAKALDIGVRYGGRKLPIVMI
jgi:hypothetical protein